MYSSVLQLRNMSHSTGIKRKSNTGSMNNFLIPLWKNTPPKIIGFILQTKVMENKKGFLTKQWKDAQKQSIP